MSSYRKPMPSFTLVLTSGHHSFRPATIQLSPAMLPTAPDFLMKTIDLRHNSTDDESVEDHDELEDLDSQTVFEAEQPVTFDHVAEKTITNYVKQSLSFIVRKLMSCKQKFVICKNGPIVPLKPSSN